MELKETKLLDNGFVEKHYVDVVPRYRVEKSQADYWFDGGEIYEYIVATLGCHFCLPSWKNSLHEIDVDKYIDNPFEDFKKQVIDKYGDKFNYYWVHELRHSGSSFTIAECPHKDNGEFTIRNWDTSNVGFVAIPKDSKIELSALGSMMTDLWEGTIDQYYVYDNYDDECVDNYEYWANAHTMEDYKQLRNAIKTKYGVDIDNLD